MACSAARKMITAKPRFFHTNIKITGKRSHAPSSQFTRSPPSATTSRFTGPPKSKNTSQMSSMAEDGIRYGIKMLLRKNAPLGLSWLSKTATRKESTHTSGVQTQESSMVFFSPSRNISFCHTLL